MTSKSMTEGISTDGAFPTGNLIFDASGNLYGTTFAGADRALLRQLRLSIIWAARITSGLSRQIVQNRNNLRLGLAGPRK